MPRLFVYSRKGKFFRLSLKAEKITIGRSSANDVIITDPYSSNLHAFIYPSDRGYVLRDNNSKNGTFLNSKRIRGEVELNKGDEMLRGSTRIMFDKELSTNVELTGDDTALTNVQTVLPLKEALKKMVMQNHASLLISDVKDDPKFRKVDSVVIPNIHSAVCVRVPQS